MAADTVFTVTNNGTKNDGSFGIVYLQTYMRQPAGTTEQVVDWDDSYVELDLGGKYLSYDNSYLVTNYHSVNGEPVYPSAGNGLYWEHSPGGPTDGIVKLAPGESVSFTLPELKGDVIYRLYTETCYPDEDSPLYTWYVFKEEGSAAPQFSDVAADDYYADAVKWAVDKGVTAGTSATTFSPNSTCTTAQILTFLWRANGSPAPAGNNAAVPAGQYYTDAANWALEKGLTDAFSADTPATRAATVTYLWKLAGKPAADAAAFTDVDAGAEYAQAVAWAVKEGITAGTSATTFAPDNTCTRGQIVTFLYRNLA